MVLPSFSGRLASSMAAHSGSAGGNTYQHALRAADQLAGGKGVLVGNGDDLVIDLGVQHVGDKARADALNLVRTGDALATAQGRSSGSTATTFTAGFCALQVFAHAGDGAAGADARDKDSRPCRRYPPRSRGRWSQSGPWGWRGSRTGRGRSCSGISFASSSALAIAPFMPFAPSVSTSSAP